MPKRALIERRPWLLGAIAVALLYVCLADSPLPGVYLLVLEVLPLLFLAVYALLRHRGEDTRSWRPCWPFKGWAVRCPESKTMWLRCS